MTEQFEHGYAVIIGVDDNEIDNFALPTVAKDVRALHDVIVHPERCGYNPDNVKAVSGKKATKKNILKALRWLQNKVEADADATAVFYYAGHGITADDQYYLIPYDMEQPPAWQNAITAEALAAEINAIQTKRLLVMFDCCHVSGFDSAAFPIALLASDGKGCAILNSSTGTQSSITRQDGEMSLFTYHLIEALTGHAPHGDEDEMVMVMDVMRYVVRHVDMSARDGGLVQTAVMHTAGVFPIAQLLGGEGLAKSTGAIPPDPLEPLPPTGIGYAIGQYGEMIVDTVVDFIEPIAQDVVEMAMDAVETVRDQLPPMMASEPVILLEAIEETEIVIVEPPIMYESSEPNPEEWGDEVAMDDSPPIMFEDAAMDDSPILMADVAPAADEPLVQPRRLEAAMPKSVRVGDTTEVLVMIPRMSDQGLKEFLPKETEAGDIIADDDLSSRDVEIEFPEPEKPIFVYIKVDANDLDFDVEDPVRKIKIRPDREGDYEAFYLTALRSVRRARVVIKLFVDEELTDSVGTIRLTVPIEPSTADIEKRLLKAREQELLYESSTASITVVTGDYITGNKVMGDSVTGDKIDIGSISGDNNAIAVGRDANANA